MHGYMACTFTCARYHHHERFDRFPMSDLDDACRSKRWFERALLAVQSEVP